MAKTRLADRIESVIPLWLKIAIVGFVASHWYIFLHALALVDGIEPLFGPRPLLYYILFITILLDLLLFFSVWITPDNKFLIAGYLILRKFRWLMPLFGIAFISLLILSGKYITSFSRLLIYLNCIAFAIIGFLLKPLPPGSTLPRVRLPKWILAILMALSPAIVSLCTLYFGLGVKITNYRPVMWNDQIGYWHWARSFSFYGFDSGYNGWDELIAKAVFNPYGENGPFYPLIYGSIGRIFGWTSYSPILINMGLIAIALFVFIQVAKLGRKQIFMTGLLTLLLWPILLYMPTSMHESLNQAIAISLASIFYYILVTKNGIVKTPLKIVFGVIIIMAAFIRLSWGLLLLPLFFVILKGKKSIRVIFAILLSIFFGFAIMQLYGVLIPPTGNIIYRLIEGTITSGPSVFFDHMSNELGHLFTRERNRIDLVVVAQLLTLVFWCTIQLILSQKNNSSKLNRSLHYFNVYNLLMPLTMALVFYLVNGYNRILITHILISALLLITQRNYWPVVTILLIGVVANKPFLNEFMSLHPNFLPDTKEFIDSRNLIEEHVVFDEDTNNRWCNTLLIPINEYNYHVPMIPPGIGISPIIYPDSIEFPLKSKFLLFNQETFTRFSSDINTETLVQLSHVSLYYNLDSACPHK